MTESSMEARSLNRIEEAAHSPAQEFFTLLGSAVSLGSAMVETEISPVYDNKIQITFNCLFRRNQDANNISKALGPLGFSPILAGKSLVIKDLFNIDEVKSIVGALEAFNDLKLELEAVAEKKEFSKEKLSDLIRANLMEAQGRQDALMKIKKLLFQIEEDFDTDYKDLVVDFKLINEEQYGQLDLIRKTPDHLVTHVSDEMSGFSGESNQGKKERLTQLALSTPPDPTGKIQVIDFTQGDISYRTARVFFPEIDGKRDVLIDVYCCVPVNEILN